MSVLEGLLGTDRPTTNLDQATVHEILANDRRQWIIEHLANIDEPTTVRELSRALAFINTDGLENPSEVDSPTYKRYYVSLYQTHLPKLEKWGLIELNQAGTVRGLDECDRVAAISKEMRSMTRGAA